MKRLCLLRHAKSSWDDTVPRDIDRPLNDKGKRAACTVGEWMHSEGLRFDHVLASPAVRVRETIEHCAEGFGRSLDAEEDKRIYLASSVTLIDVLRETDDSYETVLLVGHNPGMEDLVFDLVPADPTDALRGEVEAKYPTAAFAMMELDIGSWAEIENGCARLQQFVRPRDLDAELGPNID